MRHNGMKPTKVTCYIGVDAAYPDVKISQFCWSRSTSLEYRRQLARR
jgi:hypothetical protein